MVTDVNWSSGIQLSPNKAAGWISMEQRRAIINLGKLELAVRD
jgi:hypothetical protein